MNKLSILTAKRQLRRVVEAVKKVYDNTKEVLTKECVSKLLKEIRECEGSLNDAVERVLQWIRGGKPRVFTSRDPLVGDVATEIERNFPGRVISVNQVLYRTDGSRLTNLDIELDNIVIQVKTGGGKGLTKQLICSANNTGKIAIGYAPNVKTSVLNEATKNGFQVFTNMNDMIEFIGKH